MAERTSSAQSETALPAVSSGTASRGVMDTIAAVDLGSNSFHLIVARSQDHQLTVVDRIREPVRLGAGLDEEKTLTAPAQDRALQCLDRFGQRLRNLPNGAVRAVGTNTLRIARNSTEFLEKAQVVLGHPIEVIAGREEARLIYLGVAHGLEAGDEQRLVVDIGGGSTELISGRGFDIFDRESLHVGCVSLTRRFFKDGKIKKKRLRTAELEAELSIQPVNHLFRGKPWDRAVGCSGTIKAIGAICQHQGWSDQVITREAMERLRNYLYSASSIDSLDLPGLSEDRRPIFIGGAITLWAVFKVLDLERMDVSDQALREGVLYDLIGRITHSDVRDRTIDSLSKRWSLDQRHAHRVELSAMEFFQKTAFDWDLNSDSDWDTLKWASRLHELGLSISHGQYHKHGAYVVSNADLAGFSKNDQELLSALIRGHRRKFPSETFASLPENRIDAAKKLCVLLRLAVLLHRGREDILPDAYQLTAFTDGLLLSLPEQWIDAHPLTWLDLEQEKDYLKNAGIRLNLDILETQSSR